MCTLIVLDRVVPGHPVVIASNRDEYLARPAAVPARAAGREGAPGFVAPQDLEAGGTWMGVNARGVFCGLTNRPIEAKRGGLRSRGLLVQDALAGASAAAVAREMERVTHGSYNPFNLLYADGRQTFVTRQDERGIDTRELGPGRYVLCNRDLDDPTVPKIASIRAAVDALDPERPLGALLEDLAAVLRRHATEDRPLEGVCVHTPGYGTRSSALIALGRERWRLLYADGPPCEAKYRNHTTLLDELRVEGEMTA